MNKNIIFGVCFVLLISMFIGSAVGVSVPKEEWNKTFGGLDIEWAWSVQQASDGGYIIAGHTESYGAGGSDFWLIKTDSIGNKEWDKTFGGLSGDFAYSVQQASDGGYIIAGHTESYGAGESDFWLIKTDSIGNKEWDKTFGGSYDDLAYSIQQTSDGGYIIAGKTESYGAGKSDVWLIKTNSRGNKEWDKIFGGSYDDLAHSVQQTSDEGYIIAGKTVSAKWSADVWIIKTDSRGNREWDTTIGGSNSEWAWSVQETSDRGYIVAGFTASSGEGHIDVLLIKTDSRGNMEWSKTFGGLYEDWAGSVQQTSDGGYIITGYTSHSLYGVESDIHVSDVWIIKTDSKGNKEWDKTFGGSYGDKALSVQQTSDGGYIIAGHTVSGIARNCDIWLIKLGPGETPEITPTPTPAPVVSPTPPVFTPAPTPPGFEAIFAIAGLLAVVYFLKRGK